MAELRPTSARVRLMRAVADGAVTHHQGIYPIRDDSRVDAVGAGWDVPSEWVTVTAAVTELEHARLVRRGLRVDPGFWRSATYWELTPAGVAWLAEHDRRGGNDRV